MEIFIVEGDEGNYNLVVCWKPAIVLTALLQPYPALAAHPIGQPNFSFVCNIGPKAVRVTTEGKQLVYRFGSGGKTELIIRGSKERNNIFARREMAGGSGKGQQLRFANGTFSYVLSSLFIAGAAPVDKVRFFVVHDGHTVMVKTCSGAGSFEDYDQLDLLPRDTMKILIY
ncbi:hypothetical protein U1839_24845 [Sphingomonas sp. RT2P30]|uniref:hypothetical protein n=1 Tax=Parasphingomonas halimpatiens TaxID=3096162 RepID=UPI002FC89936